MTTKRKENNVCLKYLLSKASHQFPNKKKLVQSCNKYEFPEIVERKQKFLDTVSKSNVFV